MTTVYFIRHGQSVANVEELELLPVDPLHVHDFSRGPYYESIHRAGLGHREYYFCSANDGATQVTGNYDTYPGCPDTAGVASSPDYNASEIDEENKVRYFCTPNQDCIMGSSLDRNNNWIYADIWCDNCLSRFDPTLH